jgi:subtilisin family serine protease
MQGHSGAAGAIAIGAAAIYKSPRCGLVTEATLESYSSLGGVPILFDQSGIRLPTPIVRQKPDFVAPDRVSNTFLGRTITAGYGSSSVSQCQYDPTYPVFAGTSAATPHAAGIAALMMQANSAVTPPQIYAALQSTALPMGGNTPNFSSGYGFVQADAALAQLPPGAPTLSLASTSVATGSSTTLTWSSINTTSCTASGGWSGAQAISGTATVAPTAVGTSTYTLMCGNAVGSASSSIDLAVTAKPSGGGGGGALDELALLALAGLGIARLWRTKAPAA